MNDNGTLRSYGTKETDLLGDVIIEESVDFIESTTEPFYLEVSLMNPHSPAPVAPRHEEDLPDAVIPRTKSFNHRGVSEPTWRAELPAISGGRLE